MSRSEYVRRLLLAGGVAVAAASTVRALPRLTDVALLLFAGVLLGVVVTGLAAWVADRAPVSRRIAAMGTFALVAAALGAAAWWAGPNMADQLGNLAERVPAIVGDIEARIAETALGSSVLRHLGGTSEALRDGARAMGGIRGFFMTATGMGTAALLILFVGVYVAFDPAVYRDAILDLAPAGSKRDGLERLFDELARTLRLWMRARLVSMAVVGFLTGLGLAIAGVPLAFALALVAAVLAFIPFIGPVLSAVPAVLVGLGESPRTALIVLGIYAGVQLVESYLIDPIVEKKLVSLPPAYVIAAQAVMGALFGLLGVFLATPIAIVAVVLVQQLYLEEQLGESPEPLGAG